MSARDEIARALHRADVEPRRFDPHWNVHEWDELTDEAREYWRRLAGALMPIVERVAREVLHDAITAATFDGLGSVDADAVVRAHDRDGERYRFVTEDHADSSVRAKIREISKRFPVMSYAAASAAIDAAMRAEG